MFTSSTILFLDTHSGAIQALSIIILVVVTIYYALQTKKQAEATREQTEITKEIQKNQGIPAVEVYMRYMKYDDQQNLVEKTYFKFFNFSNIPAFVSMDVNFTFPNGETYKHPIKLEEGYRIGPNVKTGTAATFFKENKDKLIHSKDTSAELNIVVRNALSKKSNIEMKYRKKYIFASDNLGDRWNEETWGYKEFYPLEVTTELQGISKVLNEIKNKISVIKNE